MAKKPKHDTLRAKAAPSAGAMILGEWVESSLTSGMFIEIIDALDSFSDFVNYLEDRIAALERKK